MKLSQLVRQNGVLFIGLIMVSVFIYFYKLAEVPSGFYVDEASVAFNARSILETGKDEYGYEMPIYFRLMGSYTPSLFIYLCALAIKLFGDGALVFRSLSALSMLVTIVIYYSLAKKLNIFRSSFSLFISSLIFSITPWVVFNARLGYETTLAFTIFNLGMYFLFLTISTPKMAPWAVFFMSLSTYASHNQRFLAPLILLVFIFVFRKLIMKKENIMNLRMAFVVGLITQIPNLLMIDSPAFWIKNGQFDIRHIVNYLVYISPKSLFWDTGDVDMQHTIPGISLFYEYLVLFYIVGLYNLFKGSAKTSYKFIIMYFWVALVPAVFSGPFFSSQRALAFVMPSSLVIGIGIETFFASLGKKMSAVLAAILVLYSLWRLFGSYFVLFPKERALAWNYGYDQVAQFILDNPHQKFVVDHTRNPRLYVLLLYHMDISPESYQKELGSYYRDNYYQAIPPADEYRFANVEVRPVDWKKDVSADVYIVGDTLTVSESQAAEHGLDIVHEIKGPTGDVIFKIFRKTII